jgi:hypothetical protein
MKPGLEAAGLGWGSAAGLEAAGLGWGSAAGLDSAGLGWGSTAVGNDSGTGSGDAAGDGLAWKAGPGLAEEASSSSLRGSPAEATRAGQGGKVGGAVHPALQPASNQCSSSCRAAGEQIPLGQPPNLTHACKTYSHKLTQLYSSAHRLSYSCCVISVL